GAGSHFIGVAAAGAGEGGPFPHSGSRGVGTRIARRFSSSARRATERRGVELPDRNLAYLTVDDPDFHTYLSHLHWAQEFARLNREVMMDRVVEQLGLFMGEPVQRREEVNCHHNYTAVETHFGAERIVSRKGAIA